MWLSTKSKRNDESLSSPSPTLAKTREAASTTTTSDDALRAGDDWQSTLPLDWTRMHRSSGHRGRKRPLSNDMRVIQRNDNDDDDDDDDTTSNNFEGRAIFCLHDDDPSWVQGYFIPKGSTKPWGMLAIQEEVEDCLGCCSGGYRRLSLTVYHHNNTSIDSIRTRNESTSKKNSCKINGIDWTGGDMISLYHPRYVDMNAERLLTGKKALPMLHKYFQELINRLEKECDVKEGSSVLDWLPNISIVIGPMSLTLPTQ